jgi:hypothetical protein
MASVGTTGRASDMRRHPPWARSTATCQCSSGRGPWPSDCYRRMPRGRRSRTRVACAPHANIHANRFLRDVLRADAPCRAGRLFSATRWHGGRAKVGREPPSSRRVGCTTLTPPTVVQRRCKGSCLKSRPAAAYSSCRKTLRCRSGHANAPRTNPGAATAPLRVVSPAGPEARAWAAVHVLAPESSCHKAFNGGHTGTSKIYLEIPLSMATVRGRQTMPARRAGGTTGRRRARPLHSHGK